MSQNGDSGAHPSKSKRNLMVVFIIVVVAVAAATGFYLLRPSPPPAPSAPSQQTWQQWGMSIQYPSGVSPQYQGVDGQQATPQSGQVSWVWNSGYTSLGLLWMNGTAYNYTAKFQAIFNKFSTVFNNVTVTDAGNMTMAGHLWQYETLKGSYQSSTTYASYAIDVYPASQRVYIMIYTDTAPDTLAALASYGNTFSG
jgi:hypothetical protein